MRHRIRIALIPAIVAMLLGSGPALAASNACKADLNGDLVVNFGDLAVLKSVFFQRCNDPGPTCGDDVAQGPTEQCDDGNLLDGDGCSSDCTLEPARHYPATGQTTCWDTAGTVISCGGTGHDGEIQAGATLAYVDNGDGTITDTNTGLMWEKLSDDGTIHDKDNTYTWDNAFVVKIAALNSGDGFAGHADWRIPSVKELQSIVNYQVAAPGPAVHPAFNASCVLTCTVTSCSCVTADFNWTSSTYTGTPTLAWLVDFFDGFVGVYYKTNSYYLRSVRGRP